MYGLQDTSIEIYYCMAGSGVCDRRIHRNKPASILLKCIQLVCETQPQHRPGQCLHWQEGKDKLYVIITLVPVYHQYRFYCASGSCACKNLAITSVVVSIHGWKSQKGCTITSNLYTSLYLPHSFIMPMSSSCPE